MKLSKTKGISKHMGEIYQKYPEVYDEMTKFNDRNNEILKNVLKIFDIKNKVVVDLGCGTGRFTIPFSKKAKKVYALDATEPMLKILNKKINRKSIDNIEVLVTDFSGINLSEESVDMIFSSYSFPSHSENWEQDLKILRKILKKGGMIIIVVFAPRGEYWKIWNETLGKVYGRDTSTKITKWFLKKNFKKKNFDVFMEFRNKKDVITLGRAFYGWAIAGYLLAKNKKRLQIGISIFYWKKK